MRRLISGLLFCSGSSYINHLGPCLGVFLSTFSKLEKQDIFSPIILEVWYFSSINCSFGDEPPCWTWMHHSKIWRHFIFRIWQRLFSLISCHLWSKSCFLNLLCLKAFLLIMLSLFSPTTDGDLIPLSMLWRLWDLSSPWWMSTAGPLRTELCPWCSFQELLLKLLYRV